jgi:methylmalonyl-CoA mutase
MAVPANIYREPALFESIRRRSDLAPKRPKVLLLTRGDLKMRQARAQFCLNFFGCGGFAIEESPEYQGTDADLIILCASDKEYPEIAKEVCASVTQPVIVAGNPKDQIEALNAAGVAGYVHVFSNAVETLTYWQDRLGIGRAR